MTMWRIVGQSIRDGKKTGGVLLRGERVPDAWDLSIFEANGHRELSARPVIHWEDCGDMGDHKDALGNDVPDLEVTPAELEERRLRCLNKAAKRATTQCRRIIKASSFDEMLTITYRENQTDRALCKKHFETWVRRMKNALPGFQYCASFEVQERGAMHIHVATHKLPKMAQYKGVKIEAWKLGTKVWRSIVGEDNGLVFVGGKSRWGKGRQRKLSSAKMAAYVSKYIMKDYSDAPMGSNRYSRSNDIDPPKPTHLRLTGCSLDELIRTAFERQDGHSIVSHRIGHWGDSYWLCTEPCANGLL
ncbi:MAG: hypothetical protein V4627_01380 [Pseudomonadota bacterium]